MSTPIANICHCFATRQAARFVTQIYDHHLRDVGITGPQFTILAVVNAHPSISMFELAEELGMDRTSLVRALKPFYRDGYVVNEPSQSDSRKMLLTLSKIGVKKYEEAMPYWLAAQEEWNKKVGAERAEAIRKELLSITET